MATGQSTILFETDSVLLKDKVALITGAGRGLGQAVALAYTRQGARVVAVARTQSELDRTAALIDAEGGRVRTMSVDLADDDQVREMALRLIDELGSPHVLVNNAARLPLKRFDEMTLEDWDRTLVVNLRAPVLLCKLFLPAMKKRRMGSIINVSSAAGVKGFERETDYCASKYGLEGFTQSLALEVKSWNVAVNTITPGGMAGGVRIKPTSMTQAEFDALNEAERAMWDDSMILTEAFVYLALQGGSGVTGKRVYAYDLSRGIRQRGWNIDFNALFGE
jgi:NAD(P)-dependent dehydrogenase (short-subunit alcohol dehydrogenase family)